VLLVLLTAGCKTPRSTFPPPGDSAPVVRLDFRPPEGTPLVEHLVSARGVRRGEAPEEEERVELESVTSFRREGRTWVLSQQVSRARSWRGGRALDTPVDDVVGAAPLELVLAPDGAFVRVAQPERWERALLALPLDAAVQARLRDYFAPEAVEARSRQEWEAKYAGLFQRNLVVGQRLYTLERQRAGEREVGYVLERTLAGTEPSVWGPALVFHLRCLGKVDEAAPLELRAALLGAPEAALEPSVECEGEQVVAGSPFVPVRSALTVSATVAGEDGEREAWRWTQRTTASLEHQGPAGPGGGP
jgi:hypothetical protein